MGINVSTYILYSKYMEGKAEQEGGGRYIGAEITLAKYEYTICIAGKCRINLWPEAVDMNGRIQMQGGKNWILPI